MVDRQEDRACGATCGRCRECNPTESMAERVDAYKTAQSLLKDMPMPEDMFVSPHEQLVLANWLLYGGDDSE